MKICLSLVLTAFLSSILGCGGSTTQQAPSGSELQQYLAEHPELNSVEEVDDTASR